MRAAHALLFDLDNTLVHSDLAYERALARIGLSLNEGSYQKARETVKKRLPPRHVCARNRLLYFKAVSEAAGDYSPAGVLSRMEAYEAALATEVSAQWASLERERLLADLAAKYALVLVTNENLRTQLVKLRAIDPGAKIFKKVVTSEELGVEKPKARMFEFAANWLGAEPKDCVMIGDSVADDLLPARALGMQTVLTREFNSDSNKYDGACVSKLDELRRMFLT